MMDLDELYSEIIIELAGSKKHRGKPGAGALLLHGINPNCGDDIMIATEIKDGKIVEIWRDGQGCAIAEASAEVLAENLCGKDLGEAKKLIGLFLRMVQGEELSEAEMGVLGDARVLVGVSKSPFRVKCATLAWRTVEGILG